MTKLCLVLSVLISVVLQMAIIGVLGLRLKFGASSSVDLPGLNLPIGTSLLLLLLIMAEASTIIGASYFVRDLLSIK
jgi:hypothetical protein